MSTIAVSYQITYPGELPHRGLACQRSGGSHCARCGLGPQPTLIYTYCSDESGGVIPPDAPGICLRCSGCGA